MVRFDFKAAIGSLRDVGLTPVPETVRVAIPGARDLIAQGLRHFVGPAAKWLPEYEAVAAWLTENRGRGLLTAGGARRWWWGASSRCSSTTTPAASWPATTSRR